MVWGAFGFGDDVPEPVKSMDASEADYPECDYDSNLTPLYEAIEERAWIAVNQFLHSGYWPESLFADSMSPEDQARTWVTRYEARPDGSKKVRWSQLPIHAAVIFGAPSVVIQQLVEAFPQSVRCTDDHRMLPLHLAFRHGSDDSVLALFLEEFPEAVNVRGYKGRLPVECAKKGPNPERGLIIQTILKKNQTAWERKKSAVQLKEMYCVKEALKIKSQKVSHLETAIREIKSREHKTRKELANTMTELKAAKIKTKDNSNANAPQDNTAEKQAVKQLVEKLAGLEMATKDLVEKEKATKKELKKTMAELEATKRMKPTDAQSEQFAKLDKAASRESNLLERDESKKAEASSPTKKSEQKKSSKKEAPVVTTSPSREEERARFRQIEEANQALQKKIAMLEASMAANEEKQSKAQERLEEVSVPDQTDQQTKEMKSIEAEMKTLKESSKKTKEELEQAEMERQRLQNIKEANQVLEKKIAMLEASMEVNGEQQSRAQERFDEVSVPDQHNRLTDQQSRQMMEIQAEIKLLKENSAKTKAELAEAVAQLTELRSKQEWGAAAALAEKIKLNEEAQEINKQLEKKVAVLELALKQFEEKSALAKEEMKNIQETIETDSTVKLTKSQQKHMALLDAAMKKLEKNAKKTQKELDAAVEELNTFKAKEKEAAELRAALENEKMLSMERANKQLEEKILHLEATMKYFDEKASKTKKEMNQAMQDLKASDATTVASADGSSVKLTKKQKAHMTALEESMKKLENRANETRKQLDEALAELRDIKSAGEPSATKAESKAMKELARKVQALQSAMVGFEVKETRTIHELEKSMKELEAASNKRFEVLALTSELRPELATDPSFNREVAKLEKKAAKEERRLAELEEAVQDILSKGGSTKEELDSAKQLLDELLKKQDAREHEPQTKEEKDEAKQDKKMIKELTKKVATLQSAVIGFEVKETRTMKELEHTMKQLEDLTSKRFEVLEKASAMKEHDTERIAAAGALAEEKVAALHAAMKELEQNAAKTHAELETTKLELEAMKAANGEGMHQVISSQETQIKDLNEKISVLQQAVQGFEIKETKTMQELEQTMKQLEELTAKRFEVLQKVAGREIEAAKAAEANKYSLKAAEEEKKVAALEFAMRELESKAYKTKLELERTMKGLEQLETGRQQESSGITKDEKRVMRELVSKVADIQEAVMAYDEKEHKTTQELERTRQELEATRKEVEELRAKQVNTAAAKSLDAISVIANEENESQVEVIEQVNDDEDDESKAATETAKRVTEETLTSLESAIHRLVEQIGNENDNEDAPKSEALMKVIKATASNSEEKEAKSEEPAPAAAPVATPEVEAPVAAPVATPEVEAPVAPVEEPTPEPVAPASVPVVEAPTATPAEQPAAPAPDSTAPVVSAPPVEFDASRIQPKAQPKKRSLLSRLAGKKEKAPKKEKVVKEKKVAKASTKKKSSRGLFGGSSKKAAPKAEPYVYTGPLILGAPAPAPTAPTTAITAEQRKAIEAIHGAEITAVLTEEQMLDILSKMKETPDAAPAAETITPVIEKSASAVSASAKSEVGSKAGSKAPSEASVGIKEEDPHSLIMSLPSQRSMKSEKSQKSSKSQKSQKSNKSEKSQKAGSVSPAPVDTKSMTAQEENGNVLVAAGTYDDGFEINF